MGYKIQQPQPQTTLYTTVHRAYLKDFDGTPATQFLFSIHDQDWIAWYYFWEVSADIEEASRAKEAWDTSTTSRFGKRVESLQYRPFVPRRCDEFASKPENRGKVWRGNHVKGILHTERTLGRLVMQLRVAPYLDINKFEFVPLEVRTISGADRPAEREVGNVQHFLLERNTPENFAKTKRFASGVN